VSSLASKYGVTDLASIVIARNITLGMGSYQGSPGEIDIVVCVKTGLFEESMLKGNISPADKKSKGKSDAKTVRHAVKVLGIVEASY
jgi:hypothetical protein